MMNSALIEQQNLQQQVHSQNLMNYSNLIHQPQPISEQMDWNKSPLSSTDNRHVNFYYYYHFLCCHPNQPTNKQTKIKSSLPPPHNVMAKTEKLRKEICPKISI